MFIYSVLMQRFILVKVNLVILVHLPWCIPNECFCDSYKHDYLILCRCGRIFYVCVNHAFRERHADLHGGAVRGGVLPERDHDGGAAVVHRAGPTGLHQAAMMIIVTLCTCVNRNIIHSRLFVLVFGFITEDSTGTMK